MLKYKNGEDFQVNKQISEKQKQGFCRNMELIKVYFMQMICIEIITLFIKSCKEKI